MISLKLSDSKGVAFISNSCRSVPLTPRTSGLHPTPTRYLAVSSYSGLQLFIDLLRSPSYAARSMPIFSLRKRTISGRLTGISSTSMAPIVQLLTTIIANSVSGRKSSRILINLPNLRFILKYCRIVVKNSLSCFFSIMKSYQIYKVSL